MACDRTERGRSGALPRRGEWHDIDGWLDERAGIWVRGAIGALVLGAVLALGGCGGGDEVGGGQGSGGARDVAQGRLIEPGTWIGQAGTSPGRFSKPRAVDAMGENLVVVDRSGRVQVMDPKTGATRAWFTLPDMERGFPTGVKVAVSPDGSGEPAIWLADTHNHRLSVYPAMAVSTDGPAVPLATQMQPVLRFGEYGQGAGEFIYPCDVAVLATEDGKRPERVYVGEFGGSTDRVSVFDVRYERALDAAVAARLVYVRSIGRGEEARREEARRDGASASDGEEVVLARPQQVLIDESKQAKAEVASWLEKRGEQQMTGVVRRGRMLVSDSIHHRIGVFDLEGRLMRWIGGEVDAAASGQQRGSQFLHPRGMRLVGDGTLLVVEFGRNRVQHVEIATGKQLGVYGRGGSGRGELAEPWAIAILDKMAYVVDARNNRLVRMRVP